MITDTSGADEIRDLQRLLLGAGLIEFDPASVDGVWGEETQAAVRRVYEHLGWEHGADDRWITASALAAITAVRHHHDVSLEADGEGRTSSGTGGGGSHTGGGGSYTGGGGSYTGGGGSHTGGGGSHTGGGGSHTGGGGSHTGGGGSHTGGGGSHTGGGGSYTGGGGSYTGGGSTPD